MCISYCIHCHAVAECILRCLQADESEEDSDQGAASPVATDEPSETEEAEEEEEEEGGDLDAEMEDLDEQPSFGAVSDGEDAMPASIEDSD